MSTKKILGPVELLTLLVTAGIIGYILYQQGGCNVMYRAEETEMIENPGSASWKEYRYRQQQGPSPDDQNLNDMATAFAARQTPDWRQLQRSGMTEQEVIFYQKVYNQNRSTLRSAKSWTTVLQKAQYSFAQLRQVFTDLSGQPAETLQARDIELLLRKPATGPPFFSTLKRQFNIPTATSEQFAIDSANNLSDWAWFVFEQM